MPIVDFKWYTWTSLLLAIGALVFSFRSFTHPPADLQTFYNHPAADLASLRALDSLEGPLGLLDLDEDSGLFVKPPSHEAASPMSSSCLGSGIYMQWLALYLQNEKFCVLAFMNLAYCCLFLLGKATLSAFFVSLRGLERQHMYDRLLNFLLFKVVFIGAVLEPTWTQLLILATWFGVLGYLRIFSMLCRDRFEHLSVTVGVPTKTHLKIVSLLGIIIVCDFAWYIACVQVFESMLLFLTFECLILLLDTTQTLIKYVIHLGDIWANNMWESRGHLLYYTEFLSDTLILVATLAHYVHIMMIHGISFSLIDLVLFLNMRSVLNNLRKKFVSHRNHWQAMSNVRDSYQNATEADLKVYNDNCAICRESMVHAKKLPCGHLFHLTCLRSWVEYHTSNSTCPTCRRSLCEPKAEDNTPSPTASESLSPVPDGDLLSSGAKQDDQPLFTFQSREWLPDHVLWNLEVSLSGKQTPETAAGSTPQATIGM